MIFKGPHVLEEYKTPQKIIKFRCIHDGEMGPYRTDPETGKLVLSPDVLLAYRETVHDSLVWITKKIYNEGYFVSDKNIKILESLAKQYKFNDLIAWFERYWQDVKNIASANNMPLESKNRPNTKHENMKLIKQFKNDLEVTDDYSDLKQARISYLEEQRANICSHLDKLNNHISGMEDRDREKWLIDLYKSINKWSFYDGKARSLAITIAHLKGKYDKNKIVVTDEMIELAKKVPFNKLIKLEVVGNRARALCPFHNEKTPSFVVFADTNRGHCYGCGKNVDTIQYMVEVKKLGFNQAVLALLDY